MKAPVKTRKCVGWKNINELMWSYELKVLLKYSSYNKNRNPEKFRDHVSASRNIRENLGKNMSNVQFSDFLINRKFYSMKAIEALRR